MENNQEKWVNLSFISAAVLTAVILFLVAQKFAGLLSFDHVRNLDLILKASSAAVGLALFIGLYRSQLANSFMNEVVVEVTKVTWPTQNETLKATVAVLIAVTIAGFVLWIVDSVWVYFISLVI
jgi:preprotein translocase SecE subunit